jgi:hypothetical protein
MKRVGTFLTKTLSIVMITMLLALETSAEMTIKNIQIQNCSAKADQCISVTAPSAQVSSVRPIYFMKEINLEIGSANGPKEKIQKSQGYLDFDNNQLVLQGPNKKGQMTEEVYNLTTMKKQVFVQR